MSVLRTVHSYMLHMAVVALVAVFILRFLFSFSWCWAVVPAGLYVIWELFSED